MIRYVVLIVAAGFIGAVLAKPKGRSQVLWFFLCAMVPLLVIVILFLPSVVANGITRKCIYC